MTYKTSEIMLMVDEVKTNDIPTAFMRERVALGGHLCRDNVPVQSLKLVLVDDGEEQVAVSCRSPRRRHDGDDFRQSGYCDCLRVI